MNTSLDGFSEDAAGSFDWSVPDEDVHEFYNDMMRSIGTQLLGRRMHETAAVRETEPSLAQESGTMADLAAAWQDSDKLPYSTTLTDPVTKRIRNVTAFDPDEPRAVMETSSADLMVGGPELSAQALRGGLVDEIRLVAALRPMRSTTKRTMRIVRIVLIENRTADVMIDTAGGSFDPPRTRFKLWISEDFANRIRVVGPPNP